MISLIDFIGLSVQFQRLGVAQREAILRSLTKNVERLLGEMDPHDPEYSRLREELQRCARIFQDLNARLNEEGKTIGMFCKCIILLQ